ncbi:unnamed protein product [Nesidiocoris tenuis]|uniref:Uncharacterized protein n=1 Tax=Nesidiocoris tenuis TaxID=355587 RepID=A0A6H5GPW1_9HEMI|nr:unnamed protein product [Nesidiocoris tenuis]
MLPKRAKNAGSGYKQRPGLLLTAQSTFTPSHGMNLFGVNSYFSYLAVQFILKIDGVGVYLQFAVFAFYDGKPNPKDQPSNKTFKLNFQTEISTLKPNKNVHEAGEYNFVLNPCPLHHPSDILVTLGLHLANGDQGMWNSFNKRWCRLKGKATVVFAKKLPHDLVHVSFQSSPTKYEESKPTLHVKDVLPVLSANTCSNRALNFNITTFHFAYPILVTRVEWNSCLIRRDESQPNWCTLRTSPMCALLKRCASRRCGIPTPLSRGATIVPNFNLRVGNFTHRKHSSTTRAGLSNLILPRQTSGTCSRRHRRFTCRCLLSWACTGEYFKRLENGSEDDSRLLAKQQPNNRVDTHQPEAL